MLKATPTAAVSLSALSHNYNTLTAHAQGAALIPVVKADAYGHGAQIAVRLLCAVGASRFAVANAAEALSLAPFFREKPDFCKQHFTKESKRELLILGPVTKDDVLPLSLLSACLSVHSLAYGKMLSRAVKLHIECGELPESFRLPIALKAETGMHRLGIERVADMLAVCRLPYLLPKQLYSHFAEAKDAPNARTREQIQRFRRIKARLFEEGFPLFTHLSAGAALCRFGALGEMGARAGLPLYGVIPHEDLSLSLLPAMRLCATVLAVRRVRRGEGLGYGSFRAARHMRVAVLGIGYADGLPPSATGARVRIGGALFPIVGEICMDRTFLDIDALPLKEGSAVTLFGESASDTARFAAECGISPYVLLSVRSPRTARVISP